MKAYNIPLQNFTLICRNKNLYSKYLKRSMWLTYLDSDRKTFLPDFTLRCWKKRRHFWPLKVSILNLNSRYRRERETLKEMLDSKRADSRSGRTSAGGAPGDEATELRHKVTDLTYQVLVYLEPDIKVLRQMSCRCFPELIINDQSKVLRDLIFVYVKRISNVFVCS